MNININKYEYYKMPNSKDSDEVEIICVSSYSTCCFVSRAIDNIRIKPSSFIFYKI